MGKIKEIPKTVLALASMMIFMLLVNCGFVWLSTESRHDLVRDDYYASGINQDSVIALNSKSEAKGLEVFFDLQNPIWQAKIAFDSSAKNLFQGDTNWLCQAQFYRPDNNREDTVLNFTPNPENSNNASLQIWQAKALPLRKGNWEVKLAWKLASKPIFQKNFHLYISG